VARFAGPPEHLSESFIDDGLKDNVADLVLRVRLRGGATACVYCLLEHKRTQEALLLVQVLRYVTAIYAQLARLGGGPPLPMVAPLIIYNGDAKWTGPRRFSELVDVSPQLRRLTVDFGVVLVDVGAESARRLSSNQTLKGGLLGLKAAATPPERLETVITQMVGALADDDSTLKLFLRYLVGVAGREARPFVERAAENQKLGKERVMQTIADFYVSRGYRRGKREGLKAGLKRAAKKAARKAAKRPSRNSA
jgi:hypothetical protein